MRMNHSRAALGAAALVLAGTLAACSDAPTESAPMVPEATLEQQVAAMGFRTDNIRDMGAYVVVEGDIRLSKAQLRLAQPVTSNDPRRPSFQYRTTELVGSTKVYNIVVDLSSLDSDPGWQTAAREALTHWNGINNSYVRLVEGGPADITVEDVCIDDRYAADASWPSNGNPGPTIVVNSCFRHYTSHAQKVHNMVHEFGHTLGLRHSNYVQLNESDPAGAVHVPSTPTSGNDPGSVMNGGTPLNNWAGFSAADLTAVRTLYPLPKASPSVVNWGGYPLISWGALQGASSYSLVYLVTWKYSNKGTGESFTTTDHYPLGSTSGTSWHDTTRPYTGASLCDWSYGFETSRETYHYSVTASFTNGSSTAFVNAPTGQC